MSAPPAPSDDKETPGKYAVLMIFGGIVVAIALFFGTAAELKKESQLGDAVRAIDSAAPGSSARAAVIPPLNMPEHAASASASAPRPVAPAP